MKIFVADSTILNDNDAFEKNITKISKYRREKCLKLRYENDRANSLCVSLLLKKALKEYGIDEETAYYGIGERGKPYIVGHQDIIYNMSHGGNAVALAIGSLDEDVYSIGIDVEQEKDYSEKLVNRLFADEYKTVIANYEKESPDLAKEYFARYWTRREAIGKYFGTGFLFKDTVQNLPFSDELLEEKGVKIFEKILDESCGFKSKYCMAVAYDKNFNFEIKQQVIKMEEMWF